MEDNGSNPCEPDPFNGSKQLQLRLNREYNEMNGFARLWESEAGFQTSMPYLYNLISDRNVCSDQNIDIQLMIIHGSFFLVALLHPC